MFIRLQEHSEWEIRPGGLTGINGEKKSTCVFAFVYAFFVRFCAMHKINENVTVFLDRWILGAFAYSSFFLCFTFVFVLFFTSFSPFQSGLFSVVVAVVRDIDVCLVNVCLFLFWLKCVFTVFFFARDLFLSLLSIAQTNKWFRSQVKCI